MGSKIELVIADCLCVGAHSIVELVHDLAGADQRGRLNAALELVASVEDEGIPRVLLLDDLDECPHVHQPSGSVVFLGVLPLHLGGQGRAVDVVEGDDCHSGELRVFGNDEQEQTEQQHIINNNGWSILSCYLGHQTICDSPIYRKLNNTRYLVLCSSYCCIAELQILTLSDSFLRALHSGVSFRSPLNALFTILPLLD